MWVLGLLIGSLFLIRRFVFIKAILNKSLKIATYCALREISVCFSLHAARQRT